MISILLALVLLFGQDSVPVQTPHPVCQYQPGGLPDPICTPGATDPRVDQTNIQETICRRGYTATVRPSVRVTNRIKAERMQAYGLDGVDPSAVELDHLVALELGGAPADPANLWPQPWPGPEGAHRKDLVENAGRRAVCRGDLTLDEAQSRIAADWVAFGMELGVL